MREPREHAGLPGETLGKTRLRGESREEDFQRNEAIEPQLARFKDDAHAALPDEFQHFEIRKRCGDFLKRRYAGV
jgi:hypothetical protein